MCAGVVAVMDVPLSTVIPVAAIPPKLTCAPGRNPVPVIVTVVPPAVLPEAGEIEMTIGGGFVTCAVLNATACMSQKPDGLTDAFTTKDPAAETASSSAMSPFGEVKIRLVNPAPGPAVTVCTTFAPMMTSSAFVVVRVTVEFVPSPMALETESNGLLWSISLYSRIRSEEHTSELQSPCNLVCRLL